MVSGLKGKHVQRTTMGAEKGMGKTQIDKTRGQVAFQWVQEVHTLPWGTEGDNGNLTLPCVLPGLDPSLRDFLVVCLCLFEEGRGR